MLYLTIGNACNGKPSYKLVDGQYRLVSPAVVRATQQHFNCHIDGDYGGPLDTKMDYRGYVQTKVSYVCVFIRFFSSWVPSISPLFCCLMILI